MKYLIYLLLILTAVPYMSPLLAAIAAFCFLVNKGYISAVILLFVAVASVFIQLAAETISNEYRYCMESDILILNLILVVGLIFVCSVLHWFLRIFISWWKKSRVKIASR